jgi:hypothetical protein
MLSLIAPIFIACVPHSGRLGADFDEHPRLAMAKGRLCFLRGDPAGASVFVSKALTRATGDTPLLARAVWELGCLALSANNVSTAEVTLQLGLGALGDAAAHSPDLLHLEALLAEGRSERGLAIQKYREAIAEANQALTLLDSRDRAEEPCGHTRSRQSKGRIGAVCARAGIDRRGPA